MKITDTLAAATAAALVASGARADDAASRLAVVLPEEAEVALALSAAPEHLRADATVYVFTEQGYRVARAGGNGFTCLLNRDAFFYGADAFKPTCWDPAGRDSYVPVMLAVGEGLAAGKPGDEIEADIEAGFASGRFKGPDRVGIAYMLAGDISLDATGEVTEQHFPGHVMVYALGATNADIGFDGAAWRKDRSLPVVDTGGAGGARLGYLIFAPRHEGAH